MQRFFVKMTLCEGLREVNLEGYVQMQYLDNFMEKLRRSD